MGKARADILILRPPETVREARRDQKSVTVTLRNCTKDGTLFHNQFTIRPLLDRQGQLVYYLGLQYGLTVTAPAMAWIPASRPE